MHKSGHLALQFCRAWGCYVVALSGSLSKKNEALSFGAHEFLNTKELTTETIGAQPKLDFILNTTTGMSPLAVLFFFFLFSSEPLP